MILTHNLWFSFDFWTELHNLFIFFFLFALFLFDVWLRFPTNYYYHSHLHYPFHPLGGCFCEIGKCSKFLKMIHQIVHKTDAYILMLIWSLYTLCSRFLFLICFKVFYLRNFYETLSEFRMKQQNEVKISYIDFYLDSFTVFALKKKKYVYIIYMDWCNFNELKKKIIYFLLP